MSYNEFLIEVDKLTNLKLTKWSRLSNMLIDIIGSWIFLISYSLILIFWLLFNSFAEKSYRFDPTPNPLLDLILSLSQESFGVLAFVALRINIINHRDLTKNNLRIHECLLNFNKNNAETLISDLNINILNFNNQYVIEQDNKYITDFLSRYLRGPLWLIFIILFSVNWILWNSIVIGSIDPYPYSIFNIILSVIVVINEMLLIKIMKRYSEIDFIINKKLYISAIRILIAHTELV